MTKKMNRKTRNILSGILVCIAAIFAVINFTETPAADVRSFFLSTALFLIGIVVLALIAVCLFKCLIWLKNTLMNTLHVENSTEIGTAGKSLESAGSAESTESDKKNQANERK